MMVALPEVVEFPDVEALLINYLRPIVGVPISVAVPNPRPGEFVLVIRTGGPQTNVATDQAVLTIECWANGTVEAAQLAAKARAHLRAMPGRVLNINRYQEFSGPANLPDPTSGQARYTWTCVVDVRGHAI